MNTPEKSTKSENYNEYTLNRFEDAILLTLAKWNARKYGTLHLIHFCDEQPQPAVRDPALIVTSLEYHKGVNSKSPVPIRRGREANIFDTLKIYQAYIVYSASYMPPQS